MVCNFEWYHPVRAVRTGPTAYQYADRPLPDGPCIVYQYFFLCPSFIRLESQFCIQCSLWIIKVECSRYAILILILLKGMLCRASFMLMVVPSCALAFLGPVRSSCNYKKLQQWISIFSKRKTGAFYSVSCSGIMLMLHAITQYSHLSLFLFSKSINYSDYIFF